MEYPINDKELSKVIINDLIENYNYSETEAEAFVKEHGSNIISEMWDAESDYLERNAIFKQEEGN